MKKISAMPALLQPRFQRVQRRRELRGVPTPVRTAHRRRSSHGSQAASRRPELSRSCYWAHNDVLPRPAKVAARSMASRLRCTQWHQGWCAGGRGCGGGVDRPKVNDGAAQRGVGDRRDKGRPPVPVCYIHARRRCKGGGSTGIRSRSPTCRSTSSTRSKQASAESTRRWRR